jgi:hypothetical protein
MRERPIELACFGVEGAEGKRTVPDPRRRNDLGIVSSGENLIRLLEVMVGKSVFQPR